MRSWLLSVVLIAGLSILQGSEASAQNRTTVTIDNSEVDVPSSDIARHASLLLTALNIAAVQDQALAVPETLLTVQAREALGAMWTRTGGFRCPDTRLVRRVVHRPWDEEMPYEVRGIPFLVRRDSVHVYDEEGLLLFDGDGHVADVRFGIEEQRTSALLDKVPATEKRRRQIILDFVEQFRTAYNREDLSFIEKVFSDKALVIVGKVEATSSEAPWREVSSQVRLSRYSKEEYVQRLQHVFDRNEYIRVDFDQISIYQHPREALSRVYGVRMTQRWASSLYQDAGYLFLMVDFRNEQRPVIHVRTWQPVSHTSSDEAIGLGDFEILYYPQR